MRLVALTHQLVKISTFVYFFLHVIQALVFPTIQFTDSRSFLYYSFPDYSTPFPVSLHSLTLPGYQGFPYPIN